VHFHLKDPAIINEDISFAAKYCKQQKRVFIGDGDALIIPTDRLAEIFSSIKDSLPWVNRISLYGNAKSILRKNHAELARLKKLGMDRIYMGLESGHNPTLKNIRKGVNAEQMIRAAEMVRQANIFLSVTVLLGIAGIADSEIHATESGRVLTDMKPNQIAALTLMLLENTQLAGDAASGAFQFPERKILLAELRTLVNAIRLERVQFQANHASNYLPISGRLQKDKDKILQIIEDALAGRQHLKEEYQRAL
jgi:coproporphyrinogen III oxidase-like Fe-S oxidoreductase